MKTYDSDRAKNIEANFQKALPSIWDKARRETDKALEKERELFGKERRV
ncbi:hypothetical protein [Mycobacterium tuberculosis]|nr:hypothetical protein [Mycobacterium tuberculosis]